MFKLLTFAALIAVIAAKPTSDDVKSPTPIVSYGVPLLKTALVGPPQWAKVGEYVERIPSAVSHQSSTIVHDHANVVSDIVAPAVRTRVEPVVHTYAAAPVPYIAYRSGYPYAAYSYPYTQYYLDGYHQQQLYKTFA